MIAESKLQPRICVWLASAAKYTVLEPSISQVNVFRICWSRLSGAAFSPEVQEAGRLRALGSENRWLPKALVHETRAFDFDDLGLD